MCAVDRAIMERFIWRKTYPAGDTIIWANGGDGPMVVSETPFGDDPLTGIDVEIVANEPDAVTLRDVYNYYRCQDTTWEEWSGKIRAENVERRYAELLGDLKDVS